MSVRSHSYPVQILRSPDTRTSELQVATVFGIDAATASQATPAGPRSLVSFCLPPSPPYTNSHLRRAIPLPLLDENSSKFRTGSMEDETDVVQRIVQSKYGPSSLLSPPYSPRQRRLSLLSVDEEDECAESCAPPLSAGSSSSEADDHEWRGLAEDYDVSEPPSLEVKDLDLGEESDDWDEPLFLNAPSALHSSDGLALNLFGGIHSSDDTEPSRSRLDPPSSPTVRPSSLPNFDHDPPESKPLFDPSDFNVFDNDWDSMPSSGSTQSSLSYEGSSQRTAIRPIHAKLTQFNDLMATGPFPAPSSPSRRSIVDLPDDDFPDRSRRKTLAAPQTPFASDDEPTREASQLRDQIPSSSRNTLRHSSKRQPFDVPSDVFQTPFNVPLLLPSSISQTHPAHSHSLLFAPPEPQDIPLPESPEDEALMLQDDPNVPLHMLEENRIRMLHKELVAEETRARHREALLTEYIARLNTMKPPPMPTPVPLYCPGTRVEDVDTSAAHESSGPSHSRNHFISEPTPLAYAQPCALTAGPTTIEFLQVRRREVQNATALRAAERRRRKRVKERARELDALLQLKKGQLRTTAEWTLSGRRGRNDEVVVLSASGSDRHSAHTDLIFFNGEFGMVNSPGERQDEIMRLVAKMLFRRRDTSRPLSGKTMPIVREYVRSGLSRAVYKEEPHAGEYLEDVSETLLS